MALIVGLGNPGREYEGSRHNIGFAAVDKLAGLLGAPPWKRQHEALVSRGRHGERGYLLAKPQTYMNASGRAVQKLLAYYRIPLAECLVVVDDMDLALGKIRQRERGSDGGHKGLRSIIEALGTQDFKRIRIGIGRPAGRGDVVSFVLGRSRKDRAALDEAAETAARLALDYLTTGEFTNWSSP